MPFVDESVLVLERGMTGATGNLYCGLHEFPDMAFVMHVLRPGDLFVDVGSNVGSYTVLAAKVSGADCVSIEPVSLAFANLLRNTRINDIASRVLPLQCAVGRERGTIRFTTDQDTTNHVAESGYLGASKDVPVDTLDNILANKSAFLWKVDVEGSEQEMLAGAGQCLLAPSLRAVLMEDDNASIAAIMKNAGFVRAGYNPWNREITVGTLYKSRHNHLWIRGLEYLRQRCFDSPKRNVSGILI
jgi:FkbM family methyltransferase